LLNGPRALRVTIQRSAKILLSLREVLSSDSLRQLCARALSAYQLRETRIWVTVIRGGFGVFYFASTRLSPQFAGGKLRWKHRISNLSIAVVSLDTRRHLDRVPAPVLSFVQPGDFRVSMSGTLHGGAIAGQESEQFLGDVGAVAAGSAGGGCVHWSKSESHKPWRRRKNQWRVGLSRLASEQISGTCHGGLHGAWCLTRGLTRLKQGSRDTLGRNRTSTTHSGPVVGINRAPCFGIRNQLSAARELRDPRGPHCHKPFARGAFPIASLKKRAPRPFVCTRTSRTGNHSAGFGDEVSPDRVPGQPLISTAAARGRQHASGFGGN